MKFWWVAMNILRIKYKLSNLGQNTAVFLGGDDGEKKLRENPVKLTKMCQSIQNVKKNSFEVVEIYFWGPYLNILCNYKTNEFPYTWEHQFYRRMII